MPQDSYFVLRSFKQCPHRSDLVVLPQNNVKYTGQAELNEMLTEPGKLFEMTAKSAFRMENLPHETEFIALEFTKIGISCSPNLVVSPENEKHIVLQADYFAHDTPGVKESTNYCVLSAGWVYIPVSRTELGISPMRFVHKFEDPLILRNIQLIGTKPLGLGNLENVSFLGSCFSERASCLWREMKATKSEEIDLPCDCAILLTKYNTKDCAASKIIKCHSFIIAARSKRLARMLSAVTKGGEIEAKAGETTDESKNTNKEKTETTSPDGVKMRKSGDIITLALSEVHPDLFELVLAHCYGVDILEPVSKHVKSLDEDHRPNGGIGTIIEMILPLLALSCYFEIPSLTKRIEDEIFAQMDVPSLVEEMGRGREEANDNFALTSISSFLPVLASKISNRIYTCSRKERNAKIASGVAGGSSSAQTDNIYGYMLILKYFDSVVGSSGKEDAAGLMDVEEDEGAIRVQCENFWKVNSVYKYVPKWEVVSVGQKGSAAVGLSHIIGSDVVRRSNGMWELSATELNPVVVMPQYLLETTMGGRNMKILSKLYE